jgi:hypothetical protein
MSAPTIDLPRPLQPWQQWLGWFDAELAEQVGELVRRLSDLVGVAPASGRGGQPEPDGLGDLRSRGPYERLLASEWLLAEELPDEFLRRAVSSEHLFLAPRMRAAQVERSVVVVFDCGPRALGAARLAHIAAWILLARRAGELGGTLRWGVLQAPGQLHPADTPAQLGALMRSRRTAVATEAHTAQWRAAVEQLAGTDEREIWWIGASGPGMPDLGSRNERVLTLQVPLAGDTLEARLSLGASQRRTSLPLPPTPAATTLLRGDFKTAVVARRLPANRTLSTKRLSLTHGLIMSMPPGQVGVPELGNPAMLVFAVPRPGQSKLAKPRRQTWSTARPPIAVGLQRGETIALCAAENRLHFWQMPGFAEQDRPEREDFEASNSIGRWLPMIQLHDAKHQLAGVIDNAGRLVTWRGGVRPRSGPAVAAPPGATVVDRQVRTLAALGPDRLAYAMVWGDGIWLRELSASGGSSTMRRRLCPAPGQVLDMHLTILGFGTPAAQVGSLGFVHQLQGTVIWQILTIKQLGRALDEVDGAESHEVRIAQGERGVGLVNQRDVRPPALVVLSADKRRLRLATARSQTTLYESANIIERCSVCPIQGHVAVLTRDRQLVVIDPVDREQLLVVTDAQPSTPNAPDWLEPHESDHDDA